MDRLCAWVVVSTLMLGVGLRGDAAPHAEHWVPAEIVSFADFDEMQVRLHGKLHRAFMVGLRPFRYSIEGMEQQEKFRQKILAQLQGRELYAQVVTRQGDVIGLSLDTFRKGDDGAFGGEEKDSLIYFCRTGWGAYNFNLFYLYTQTALLQDNFAENRQWRMLFLDAHERIERRRLALHPE